VTIRRNTSYIDADSGELEKLSFGNITYDQVLYDLSNDMNTATGIFTAPVAGINPTGEYLFQTMTMWINYKSARLEDIQVHQRQSDPMRRKKGRREKDRRMRGTK
jgi:hypothetical protein